MKPNGNCRTCGHPIVWVITDANGRRMPLDPEPVADGNVWVDRIEGGSRVVMVALHADAVPRSIALRYQSHFVSCKDANEWRRR